MSEQALLPELVTSSQVRESLNISQPTLERWCALGKLKYYNLPGGERRYDPADVRAIISKGDPQAERAQRMRQAVAVNRGELAADEASA